MSDGPIRTFESGATRSADEGKPDYEGFLSPLVIERFGEYMTKHRKQADGALRASDNWQKGIPRAEYMKSAWRHFVEWWKEHRRTGIGGGYSDAMEEALCAMLFNVQGYLHELLMEKRHPMHESASAEGRMTAAIEKFEMREFGRTIPLNESASYLGKPLYTCSACGAQQPWTKDGLCARCEPQFPLATANGDDQAAYSIAEPTATCPHCGESVYWPRNGELAGLTGWKHVLTDMWLCAPAVLRWQALDPERALHSKYMTCLLCWGNLNEGTHAECR